MRGGQEARLRRGKDPSEGPAPSSRFQREWVGWPTRRETSSFRKRATKRPAPLRRYNDPRPNRRTRTRCSWQPESRLLMRPIRTTNCRIQEPTADCQGFPRPSPRRRLQGQWKAKTSVEFVGHEESLIEREDGELLHHARNSVGFYSTHFPRVNESLRNAMAPSDPGIRCPIWLRLLYFRTVARCKEEGPCTSV